MHINKFIHTHTHTHTHFANYKYACTIEYTVGPSYPQVLHLQRANCEGFEHLLILVFKRYCDQSPVDTKGQMCIKYVYTYEIKMGFFGCTVWPAGLSSLARDRTHTSCIMSKES